MCGGNGHKDGVGHHMIVTEHLGSIMEMLGVSRYPPCINDWYVKHARTIKQERDQGQANCQVSKSWRKRGKQNKNNIKKWQKEIKGQNKKHGEKPKVV